MIHQHREDLMSRSDSGYKTSDHALFKPKTDMIAVSLSSLSSLFIRVSCIDEDNTEVRGLLHMCVSLPYDGLHSSHGREGGGTACLRIALFPHFFFFNSSTRQAL